MIAHGALPLASLRAQRPRTRRADGDPTLDARSPRTGTAQADSRARVLVVDDDWATRDALRLLLLDAGWFAESAENGRAALQRLQAETWDIVLTDLNMPEMDGLSLIAEIKQLAYCPDVVLMSASIDVSTVGAADRAGVRLCVEKPFDFDFLLARLRGLSIDQQTRADRHIA